MGVGVRGESGAEVPRCAGHSFDVRAILDGRSGESVSQIVKPPLGQSCPFQHPAEHVEQTVRGEGTAGGQQENLWLAPRFFFCSFRMPTASSANYGRVR